MGAGSTESGPHRGGAVPSMSRQRAAMGRFFFRMGAGAMIEAVRCAVLAVSLWGLVETSAGSEVIVAYESLNPMGGVLASEFAPGVGALPLGRGPGLTQASGATFNTRDWTVESTPDPDDFLEWGWASSDSLFDLETLDVRYDRSGTGPAQLALHLAVNGGPFESIFSDADVSSMGESQLGIDLSHLDGIGSATFRLFGFGAGRSSGTFDLENFSSAPNRAILVSGSTSTVPEPGMFTLIWSLSVGLIAMRASRRIKTRRIRKGRD